MVGISVGLDHGLDLPDDAGVDSTAESLVGGDGDQHPLLSSEIGFFLVEIWFAVDNSLDGTHSEGLGSFESSHVLPHFGGCHHLHGLDGGMRTLVIFLMDSTAFILILMALRFLVAKANWFWNSRDELVVRRLASIIN